MNTPRDKKGRLNYNFNPAMQIKEYIEAIYADIKNELNSRGVELSDQGEVIRDPSSSSDEKWELVFESASKKREVTIIYETKFDCSWITSENPEEEIVRFPKIKCQFYQRNQNTVSDIFFFSFHAYELKEKILLEMITIFLKKNLKKKTENQKPSPS